MQTRLWNLSGQKPVPAQPSARRAATSRPKMNAPLSRDVVTLRFGSAPPPNNSNAHNPASAPDMIESDPAPPLSPVHLVNEVPYKTAEGVYQMVVEIPAGTVQKWQTDAKTGQLYHDQIDGKPRNVNYLPYPMNYGMIPQTVLSRAQGGDGDPLDVVILGPALPRGSVQPLRILGALKLTERGETDTKIVAVREGSREFADVNDLGEMFIKRPNAIEIVRMWFEGYKGAGAFTFSGYANRQEAIDLIEAAYAGWKAETGDRLAQSGSATP